MSKFFKWFLTLAFTLAFLGSSAFAQPPHHGGPHHSMGRPPISHGHMPPPRYHHYHHESFGRALLRELLYAPPVYTYGYRYYEPAYYYYPSYQPRLRSVYVNGRRYTCRECSYTGSVNCDYSGNYDCCECVGAMLK